MTIHYVVLQRFILNQLSESLLCIYLIARRKKHKKMAACPFCKGSHRATVPAPFQPLAG